MRFVFIKVFRFKRTYLGAIVIAAVLLLAGLNSVFALNPVTPATSWAVANRVIVVDPGHGGVDPGATGYNGITEKEIVLQVAKRLSSLLNHAGAKVIMTRDSDKDLSGPGSGSLSARKKEDLTKRVQLANEGRADLYISVHVNAFPSSRWSGAQTFYQRNQQEGKKLAESIQSELIRILGNTTREAKAEDFFTTRNTKMAGVIVEIGFLSNPREAKLMTNAAYQRKLAYAIYSGLVKYYREQLPLENRP